MLHSDIVTDGVINCMVLVDLVKDKYPGQNVYQKLCLEQKDADFDGITMGQFVDGVDEFYKDFRNKQLDVSWAAAIR